MAMEDWHALPGEPDLSVLDRIAWIELDHAYGSAIDVPHQIRSLVKPDAEVRRRAIFGFYSNLFHQSTVYSATVAAIPVFQHLLRYEQIADKSANLKLLASFAIGGPEEVFDNVDLTDYIDATGNGSWSEDRTNSRDCYLAVGAAVSLYEYLLNDTDPRVVISAAFTLAFFPVHAFGSCGVLLAIAGDDSKHAFVRSSALIATSYLSGGTVRENFLQVLRALLEGEEPDDERAMSFPAATAVYCLLRERQVDDQDLRTTSEKLAVRCIERGIQLPECPFYRVKKHDEGADPSRMDVNELLMPEPQFPWGDLTARIRRHTNYRQQQPARTNPQEHRGPDPDAFDVKPDAFDRDNVIAAVRRLHACYWGPRQSVPVGDFVPFKPYAMLAWDEVLRLLDSDVPEDRWAAAHVLEHFAPLDEPAIDQLIERLHRGNNSSLGNAIGKQPLSEDQCRLLCERLCRGDFVRSEYSGPRDDYRSIVLEHGKADQLWKLFRDGEFKERAAAAQELSRRGKIEPAEALPVFAESLESGDYGLTMTAKWTFANWKTAHRWFLEAYDSLPQTRQWAIAEALSGLGADLTELQEALFARIEVERNQVLAARLVDVVAHFPSPQPATVDRLVKLCHDDSPALVRWAVVRTLGSWIGKEIDAMLSERLQTFAKDPSPRVRQAAIAELPKFSDPSQRNIVVLRRLLSDEDLLIPSSTHRRRR